VNATWTRDVAHKGLLTLSLHGVALLVYQRPIAESHADGRVCLEIGDQGRDHCRLQRVILVQEKQIGAIRDAGRIAGGACATCPCVLLADQADARVGSEGCPYRLSDVIGAPVVDNYIFPSLICLRSHAGEGLSNMACAAVVGRDDTHARLCLHKNLLFSSRSNRIGTCPRVLDCGCNGHAVLATGAV